MKQSTIDWLLDFLQTHTMGEDYLLKDLFYNEIIPREYTNIDELIIGIDDFFDFLHANKHLIKIKNAETKSFSLDERINCDKIHVKTNIIGSHLQDLKHFAEVVSDLSPEPQTKSILEVGSGVIPLTAMHLTKRFKRVSAMNPYFFLSTLALNSLKVYPISEIFDNSSDISNYDIVVGKSPCSAIEPIVRLCTQQKKPYFIQLCNCSLDDKYAAKTEAFGWENVLPQIDPNIQFYKEFAFHLDKTTEEVVKSINHFYMLDKRKTKLFGGKYINNVSLFIEKSEISSNNDSDANKETSFDDLGFFY